MPTPFRRLFRLATRRPPIDREVADEIDFHLQSTVRELVDAGMSPSAARDEARRRFGDVERVRDALGAMDREHAEQVVRVERWRNLGADVWQSVRTLMREPAFTATVAITLALGIGANATMFGVVDRLLLRPPSQVRDPDGRLSLIYFRRTDPSFGVITYRSTSYPVFENLRTKKDVFDDAAAIFSTEMSLGRGIDARKAAVVLTTPNMFELLGVRPTAGRFFTTAEWDQPPVNSAVVSGAFADREYGSPQAALGHKLELNGLTYDVVGVAPRGFTGPKNRTTDVFVPMAAVAGTQTSPRWRTTTGMRWLEVVARRRPGVGMGAAGATATLAHQQFGRNARTGDSSVTVIAGSMIPARGPNGSAQAKVALWLTAVSGIVLLIACANVANLLLARAVRRRRELAVRLALGVARGRLILQLLVESLTLAVVGGVVALLIAHWGSLGLRATLLSDVAWEDQTIDLRVALFTAGVIALTGLLAGVAPALTSSRTDLAESLKNGDRESGGRRSPLRSALIIMQASLCVMLLVGAGLFALSFRRATTQDIGFDADHLVFAKPDLSVIAQTTESYEAKWREAVERVRAVPGVVSATQSVTTPFESQWEQDLYMPGKGKLPPLEGGGPYVNAVEPAYFSTMGTRLLRGRGFTDGDVQGSASVVAINDAMAKALWPGQDALGKCFQVSADTVPCSTVVGIVANARVASITSSSEPEYFIPLKQWSPDMRVMFARVAGSPTAAVAPIRRALAGMSSTLPYIDVRPMSEILEPEIKSWRLGATMFSIFGLLAFVVAIVGTYSVVAYDVTQRRREIGVRMALGAQRRQVVGSVMVQALRTSGAGVVVGLGLAFVTTRFVESLLFNTSSRDPIVFATVAVVLVLAALLASFVPARQAARTDPALVLRSE